MVANNTGTHDVAQTLRVRSEGEVDAEALAYLREKVGAVLARPGLPAVRGEVRISRSPAHVQLPWSAAAEIEVDGELVVVHAEEASAHEAADRLQDRLRARTERAAHRRDSARRTATPPPWRGGPGHPEA
ncbi:hypothetical protein ACFYOV_27250 [Streptomyces sp. NPDC005931]|uniref:hypothetical protein n=1 Tax=Streptomyces sp. NPDC005931 TaxID=3364737 RepID=UPI0036AF3E1C